MPSVAIAGLLFDVLEDNKTLVQCMACERPRRLHDGGSDAVCQSCAWLFPWLANESVARLVLGMTLAYSYGGIPHRFMREDERNYRARVFWSPAEPQSPVYLKSMTSISGASNRRY